MWEGWDWDVFMDDGDSGDDCNGGDDDGDDELDNSFASDTCVDSCTCICACTLLLNEFCLSPDSVFELVVCWASALVCDDVPFAAVMVFNVAML